MKLPIPYVSALAICKATDEEIKFGSEHDAATDKHKATITCLFKRGEGTEWVKVFETQPYYATPEEAIAAITKFGAHVKETTPWAGREWPLEKGPVPYGFTIHAGPKGERLLARPKAKRAKGPNFTKPRR